MSILEDWIIPGLITVVAVAIITGHTVTIDKRGVHIN